MKSSILIILISFTLSPLLAQKISIGGEAGFISSINTNYRLTDIENRRNTYYTGLNISYHFNEKISLTSGLHYQRQGYRHETCYIFADGVKNELVGMLDYILIPLSLNLNLGKSHRFITMLGVYGGVNIQAAQDHPEILGGCSIYYPMDLSHVTQKRVFGGLIGVGYKVIDTEKFALKPLLRYTQGISNVMKNNPDWGTNWQRRYSALMLTISLDYRL